AEERDAVDLPAVVDRDDVRMTELRDGLRLAREIRGEADAKGLESDEPFELGVVRLIDGADPAAPDFLDELVASEPADLTRRRLQDLIQELQPLRLGQRVAGGAELAEL